MTTPTERLIATTATLLEGVRHVAVGAASPVPAAAAMLARARHEAQGGRMLISILGSPRHNFFTNGGVELFDSAAQGRVDAFFLGGGQIDGQGNINLIGIGEYPAVKPRWPGCFGSPFLYFQVPRVILFRQEHSRRVLVPRVDFVSAPGVSPPGIWRRGGPHALLTGKALFGFDAGRGRFVLRHTHPGETADSIAEATGFDYDLSPDLSPTPDPDAATLALLRGRVLDELSQTYPRFARSLLAERGGP